MKRTNHILHSLRSPRHVVVRVLQIATMALLFAATTSSVFAQLSGTKTIGASGDYTTIESAISALVTNGVSGPVTFLISNGTYTPPAGGYVLPSVTGMSATNTVTFKPATGATVTITGTTNNATGVFTIDNGDYFIIDGSNTAGGTSRNMTIIQGNTSYGASLFIKNDADFNVLKNTIIQSSHGTVALDLTLGGVTIFVAPNLSPAPGANGNDSNLIENNQVGDVNGLLRSHRAIYSYGGSAAAPNVGLRVIGNDVVNFGNTNTNAMGIFISYFNNGAIVRGNIVRMTSAPVGTTAAYGLYVNESLGNGFNPTVEGNVVYGLRGSSTTSQTIVGLLYACNSNNNSSNARIINNMISLDRGSETVTAYWTQILLAPSNVNLTVAHNSFYMGGSTGTSFGIYISQDGSSQIALKNNAMYAPFTSTSYLLYVPATLTTGFTSTNNLYEFPQTTSQFMAYFGQTTYATLAAFQAATGHEAGSVTGNPRYIDPSTANLHISPTLPTPVESRGTPIASVTTDFDGNTRSATAPDIGADEGNFNGGGFRITQPNGGETYLGGQQITILYDANRAMSARLEFSSNNGATWSLITNTNPTATGSNSFAYTLPDIATTQARIRVYNTLNPIEGDTTNAVFNIVQPSVQIISPNGGESYYQADVVPIRWSSTDMPAASRVTLDYSTNGGTSWTQIATNLVSNNSPAINTYNWSIPSVRTDLALVRVSMIGRAVSDQSDRVFSILKAMNLLSPSGGEQWYVGDRQWIKWKVNQVDRLDIQLSTDGGVTWKEIAPRVWSRLDSFAITVPNTPSTNALVRIVNSDNPAFTEQSAAPFSILRPSVQVITPNGGEKYELNQPVTVIWSSANQSTLRLEYSSGGSWLTIATGIPAAAGSFTFTPPGFPTKLARVRLIDEARPAFSDASDGAFEIMEAPGISVFSPSQGEEIMRGSIYEIVWQANRVGSVHIEYSANGGAPGTWQRIVSNLPAGTSTYMWTVPASLTSQGKIRVVEAAGSLSGESGIFAIVEPRASVHLRRPNGGEVYTSGDPITITWTSSLVGTIALQFSTNSGATWTQIPGAENLPAAPASFTWTAPEIPGTNYRVRIVSGALSDMSDADFTINRALAPGVTVTYPNGGENFVVDSVVNITWTLRDYAGDVTIDMSTDNGVSWTTIETMDGVAGSYEWTVPDAVGTENLVRVSGPAFSDQSDNPFEISRRIIASIALISPNTASTMWTEGDTVEITWAAVAVPTVDIQLSTDGGTTWTVPIGRGIDATLGTYSWVVTRLADTAMSSLAVRISNGAGGSPSDVSSEPFGYRPKLISGADRDAVAGALRVIGAFPNPFSTHSSLRWSQPTAADAFIRIYGVDGRITHDVALGRREAGANELSVSAGDLADGVYVYEIRVGNAVARGTMTVVR